MQKVKGVAAFEGVVDDDDVADAGTGAEEPRAQVKSPLVCMATVLLRYSAVECAICG